MTATAAPAVSQAPAFDAWLDAFFASYTRHRPVNATFIGVHTYDDRLPDASEQGAADRLSDAEALLARLRALPSEPLSVAQTIDRQLAEGCLEIERWEVGSAQFGFCNPSLFTGEAVFGSLSLLLRSFAPFEQRLECLRGRLEAVPADLEAAQHSLQPSPLAWIERARRECSGARLLLGSGLARLLHAAGVHDPRLERAAGLADEAFGRFETYLADQLLPRATQDYACGPDALELLLRRAHFLEEGAADELEQLAVDLLAAADHPSPASRGSAGEGWSNATPVEPALVECVPRCAELWQMARDFAQQHDLLTFPDWPVHFVQTPEWVREAAPYLYFLNYRAPAPFDATPGVYCYVPARADEATIALNYVVHHASLGHHVQNWFAMRSASRIGQLAAVDCASRIAMLCGGSLAEGWASYAVDLAIEHGFVNYDQTQARRRMAVRAIVDLRLHQGRLSLDEAAQLYEQQAAMSAQAARAEATKNSLFPGGACMYLLGWSSLHELRRELQARAGAAFSLHAFHDSVLAFGSVPVTLIARALRAPRTD
jgi:uncharacterized protein (DUF885 family)